MNRFDKIIYNVIKFGLLPVIIVVTWAALTNPSILDNPSGPLKTLWTILDCTLLLWIFSLFYLVVKMVLTKSLRDAILIKFAGMKERDERESYISGEAAKFSVLSTMAVMVLLLFFSLLMFYVKVENKNSGLNKHLGTLQVGFNFNPLKEESLASEPPAGEVRTAKYSGIPLSDSIVIMILLIWQIGSYRFFIKKLQRD